MIINALYPNTLADNVWIPNDRERTTFTLFNHATDHSKYAAEIVAIERELGLNPSADFTDVSERLDDFDSRLNSLETEGEGDFVSRNGDTMTGMLTVPELVLGNISDNLEGIRFSDRGYIKPLENFTNDAFKVQTIGGITLFEVPFNGTAPKLGNGATILTSINHLHRTDPENDLRYFMRSDRIGHRIVLEGSRERYKHFTVGSDGTETLTLDTEDFNHFKIKTNGANVDVNITGVPTSDFRKGVTIALQNIGSSPATLRVLNAHVWADSGTPPSLTTNPGRDTEVFGYSIGEGDRWMLHQYYVNLTVRSLAATYPSQMTHHYKLYGRGNITPLTVTDELTAVNMNFAGGVQFTLEGAQMTASPARYMFSDKMPGLTLQSNVAIITTVKNIAAVQEFAALGSIASSARTTNNLRADKLSSQRLRARLSSQTGTYTNATNDTPSIIINSGSDVWTMVAAVKTEAGFGVYNMNSFARGEEEGLYRAFRDFPETPPVFDAASDMRIGVGIVPVSNYSTTPTGLGTFICADTIILEGNFTPVELMQVYRSVRQEMLGLGLTSLPAPSI